MSDTEDSDSEPERPPIERAIQNLEEIEDELKDASLLSSGHYTQSDAVELEAKLEEVRELVDEHEERIEQQNLRNTVRGVRSYVRELRGGPELSSIEAARELAQFYQLLITNRKELLSIGNLNSVKFIIEYIIRFELPTKGDLERVRSLLHDVSDSIDDLSEKPEQRPEIEEEFLSVQPAYQRLDIEPAESVDSYLPLPRSQYEQFDTLLRISQEALRGMEAGFQAYLAAEDERWAEASDGFAQAETHLQSAVDRYRTARVDSQNNPLTNMFNVSYSSEREEEVLESLDWLIDFMAELDSVCDRAATGNENAISTFEDRVEEFEGSTLL